jgi:hypothetical protein
MRNQPWCAVAGYGPCKALDQSCPPSTAPKSGVSRGLRGSTNNRSFEAPFTRRLQLPHRVRMHFEKGKPLIGETVFGERHDPLWPQLFRDCRNRVLSDCGGGPMLDRAVPCRFDNIDAARDPFAHNRLSTERNGCAITSGEVLSNNGLDYVHPRSAACTCRGLYGLGRNRPPCGISCSIGIWRPEVTMILIGGHRCRTARASLRPSIEPGI